MPTAAQVKALIRSHSEGNDQRFYAVALQVAAQAARQGHSHFAQELRDVIDRARSATRQNGGGQRTRPVPMVQPRGELAGLLTAAYPKTRLTEMALAADISSRIERVLTEQRQRDIRLQAHGLMPQRRLLLVGPSRHGEDNDRHQYWPGSLACLSSVFSYTASSRSISVRLLRSYG